MKSEIEPEMIVRAAKAAGLGAALSRREFLCLSAGAVTSLAALNIGRVWGADAPVIIIDNAKGLLLADPSRCVGCLRCELACTEFNDGRAQPSLARIKVDRNINFGPEGPSGGARMQGAWGNGLFIQDTCRQCPHPVPCATACPENAIKVEPETGARIVDTSACVGCRLCQRACPWNMINFDEHSQKATKCFLCQGNPKCAEACPSGALRYVPWRDSTREAASRTAALPAVTTEKAKGCLACHVGR
jgi:Fe-S-cluster-containing dehydrogenase component